jgi:cytochrome P450
VLGDGLIIVEGSQHKFLRKNTMPAFHFRHIRDLYPMMWAKSISLTSALQQGISGRERMDSHIVGKSGHVGYYRDCRNGS